MGGQLGICIPSEELLIVTTADTQGLQGGNQIIYDAIYENLLEKKDCKDAPSTVSSASCAKGQLTIAPPHLPESYGYFGIAPKGPDVPVEGLEYRYKLDENPAGFEELTVHLTSASNDGSDQPCTAGSKQGFLEFVQKDQGLGRQRHRIAFGLSSMVQGIFPIYETRYVAGGLWTRDNVLYIKAHLIGESVGSVHFQLYFGDGDIVLFMKKIEETFFTEFEGHLYGRQL